MEEDQDAIQRELQQSLATPVSSADLAHKIGTLLASLGKRVDIRVVAQRLAEDLASRFTHKSAPLQRLMLSLDPAPPTGPCLDEIFRGGRYKMSGAVDSLQWLFGLRRKRLSMARPALRRARKIFYDYRGVLACMDALLKNTGPNAFWLPDPDRRQTVLTGVLFRARQEAKPTIRRRFEKTLLPHLN